jgi:hypothetical protein
MPAAALPRTTLDATWPTGAAFLDAFDAQGLGRVEAPVRSAPPPLGEELQLRARIEERNLEVMALCRVVTSRSASVSTVCCEFLEGQQSRRDLLLALARGDSVPWGRRKSARIAVMLSATVHSGGRRLRAHTVNVSDDGLCVLLPERPELAAQLTVRVWPMPVALMWPPFLKGRVTGTTPLKNGHAVGINLSFVSAKQANGWKRLVSRAGKRLL